MAPDPVDTGYFTIPMLDYRFVEFIRVDDAADVKAAVEAILGEDYTAKAFKHQFGVDLSNYIGYYVEVSYTDAPRGPVTPMTIEPILALRRSRSGQQFRPNVLKVPGYYDRDRKTAWIEAEMWESHIGDDIAKKARARLKEADELFRSVEDPEDVKNKRKEVLEELLGLIRDPGIDSGAPDGKA